MRILRHGKPKPTITSYRPIAGKILDSWSDLMLPTVAPGSIPGALRFVSLALHVIPHKDGRLRRSVSARNVSAQNSTGNVLNSFSAGFRSTIHENRAAHSKPG